MQDWEFRVVLLIGGKEPFDPDDQVNDQIADKLAEARQEYEALRTKRV